MKVAAFCFCWSCRIARVLSSSEHSGLLLETEAPIMTPNGADLPVLLSRPEGAGLTLHCCTTCARPVLVRCCRYLDWIVAAAACCTRVAFLTGVGAAELHAGYCLGLEVLLPCLWLWSLAISLSSLLSSAQISLSEELSECCCCCCCCLCFCCCCGCC